MAGKSAVFVDLDSLNVLLKYEDKFVAALNYSGNIDRLGSAVLALGVGYDIYLCLKPRAPGEGDLVINELSITGMPFTTDAEELYQVLSFFRDYNGLSDIYLCNWVNNYIQVARVQTFESAIYYGDRVAYLNVKDGILEQFKVYKDRLEFEATYGPEYDGYGDLGLVDIDGFKAQYPEFSGVAKPQLVSIAPLAHCYRTAVKLNMWELYDKLKDARESGVPLGNTYVEPEYKAPEVPEDPNNHPVEHEPEKSSKPAAKKRRVEENPEVEPVVKKAPMPLYTKVLLLLSCLAAFLFGVTAGTVIRAPAPPDYSSYVSQVQSRVVQLQGISDVFSNADTFIGDARNALAYCEATDVPISIAGFERQQEQFVIRYFCMSESDNVAFSEYVGNNFTIVSSNNLGPAETEGQTVYQYTLSFA